MRILRFRRIWDVHWYRQTFVGFVVGLRHMSVHGMSINGRHVYETEFLKPMLPLSTSTPGNSSVCSWNKRQSITIPRLCTTSNVRHVPYLVRYFPSDPSDVGSDVGSDGDVRCHARSDSLVEKGIFVVVMPYSIRHDGYITVDSPYLCKPIQIAKYENVNTSHKNSKRPTLVMLFLHGFTDSSRAYLPLWSAVCDELHVTTTDSP